ncbi:hypothetical protein [Rhizobium sp.]|uniref:hypothetical protein n=1 Tax=Rhizobium sp. TaxID=391 RepID=UPI000E9112CE|nr:hypothetical protein [Rhizobium sp.]
MFNPTIRFCPSNIAELKKALREQYFNVSSSHADEALAASLGFRTHAAMLNILNQIRGSTRLIVQIDPLLMLNRLEQLGYTDLNSQTLRKLMWETILPDRWQDDELQTTIRKRFIPAAANA